MKFQDSKLEIEAPKSKTYILHYKMYVFSILEWNFKISNLKFKDQSQKHTFYTVKCMFFPILKWNFKIPSLKLKPQSQKHTFYTVKYMFLEGQLLEDQILMHFFANFWRFQGKHTFYSVKCMFLLFQMCVKKSMLFWKFFWGLPKKYVIQRVVFWEAQAG